MWTAVSAEHLRKAAKRRELSWPSFLPRTLRLSARESQVFLFILGCSFLKLCWWSFAVNNITSNKFALCKALWLKWQAALRVVKVHSLFPCKVHLHIEEEGKNWWNGGGGGWGWPLLWDNWKSGNKREKTKSDKKGKKDNKRWIETEEKDKRVGEVRREEEGSVSILIRQTCRQPDRQQDVCPCAATLWPADT